MNELLEVKPVLTRATVPRAPVSWRGCYFYEAASCFSMESLRSDRAACWLATLWSLDAQGLLSPGPSTRPGPARPVGRVEKGGSRQTSNYVSPVWLVSLRLAVCQGPGGLGSSRDCVCRPARECGVILLQCPRGRVTLRLPWGSPGGPLPFGGRSFSEWLCSARAGHLPRCSLAL